MLRACLGRGAPTSTMRRGIHMSRLAHLDFLPSRNQLPWPPLVVGEMQKSRLREHYERTLAADMMYMMYAVSYTHLTLPTKA